MDFCLPSMCTARTTNRGWEKNVHTAFHLQDMLEANATAQQYQIFPNLSHIKILDVSKIAKIVCWSSAFLCGPFLFALQLHVRSCGPMCSCVHRRSCCPCVPAPGCSPGFPFSFCFPSRKCHLGDRILLHFLFVTPVFITREHLMSKCLWEVNWGQQKYLLTDFSRPLYKSLF